MEQHPIPQNVSSYQFKLVGDMTLKQFFQLAGGIVVGLIFYSTPLLPIIKWPLIIISTITGALMAFVPFEERPLEKWILAFFRAIYSPTEFFWKKTIQRPKFFQDEPTGVTEEQNAAAKQYLGSTATQAGPLTKLDMAEQGFLSKLTGIFSSLSSLPTGAAQTASQEKKKELQIPETAPIRVSPMISPHLVIEEKPVAANPAAPQVTMQAVAPIIAGDEIISTKQAIFSVDAAPPSPPTTPNTIVGQVVDQERKIIEAAIIEIRDSMGRPIRALRSNKAGHFITVTPLDNGRYDIVAEKDGYEFSPVSFNTEGSLIPPILVQGRRVSFAGAPQTVNPAVVQS